MTYRATYQIVLDDAIIVDNFAGGGGASTGMEMALGRAVNLAINHDPQALQMHEANHPLTRHLCEDVYAVDPLKECGGRKISDIWFSPDCTHFSKAKGGKPKSKKRRGLAYVVLKWASLPADIRPDRIYLENVEEFLTWCRLKNGQPDMSRKGENFRGFVNALRRLGYDVEWRVLRAADHDVPTIRKRLFLVARFDGLPIEWPKPTHAKTPKKGSGLKPWRTAAECIDWSVPARSIFDPERKLLAENTHRRIAKGFKKFVLDVKQPFLVSTNHGYSGGKRHYSIDMPLNTITQRNGRALVTPYLTEHANGSNQRVFASDEPLRTQCANVKGGHFALVAPSLIEIGYGERKGQEPRAAGLGKPLGTIVAGGAKHALTALHLQSHFGSSIGSPADQPLGTVTQKNKYSVAATYLVKHFGGVTGSPVTDPMPTQTTRGTQTQIAAAHLTKLRGTSTAAGMDEPLHTVSAGGTHHALTTAYMVKYYGNEKDGASLAEPMHTITAKDRHGLVRVVAAVPPLDDDARYNAWVTLRFLEQYGAVEEDRSIIPRPRAQYLVLGDHVVVDIGMRMLTPRELYTANGFPKDYVIDRDSRGNPITKTDQVRMCGNSVPPPLAAAVVAANAPKTSLFTPARRPVKRPYMTGARYAREQGNFPHQPAARQLRENCA